jgi:fumarate reductase subunit D
MSKKIIIDQSIFTSEKTQTILSIISYISLLVTTVFIGYGILEKQGFSKPVIDLITKLLSTMVIFSWFILLISASIKMNAINEAERISEIKKICDTSK